MQILLDVKDSKAALAIEMLNNLAFVKNVEVMGKKNSREKSKKQFLTEFEKAIDELNLVRAGKKKSRNASQWIDSL